MEELNMIREYYDEDGEDEQTCDSWEIVSNYILKAQAQERELEELINKIKDILALNYSCQEIGIKIKRLFKEEMK